MNDSFGRERAQPIGAGGLNCKLGPAGLSVGLPALVLRDIEFFAFDDPTARAHGREPA